MNMTHAEPAETVGTEPMLPTVERILAEARGFGDSDYIRRQMHDCYHRRLTALSADLPFANDLASALEESSASVRYQIYGDPVVRCAIRHAMASLETGVESGLSRSQCEAVLRETLHHLESGSSGSPLAARQPDCKRLGPKLYHGFVWSEEHGDDSFGLAFRNIVEMEYGETLCTPDSQELEALAKATELLEVLLPALSRSALSHAHVVCIFPGLGNWKGRASSSLFRISGAIFLNRRRLHSPWWVAEHILHEALHQKLYDFRTGHSLFQSHHGAAGAKVLSLWNKPRAGSSNLWDTDRAMAAFHVYVHLALLSLVAEQRQFELAESYGPLPAPPAVTDSSRALARAHYLGEQLENLCWLELGPAGQTMVDWLTSILDLLDPTPPPRGAKIHLLFDLYEREAGNVDGFLNRRTPPAQVVQHLSDIIENEVDITRRILKALDEEALSQFNAHMTSSSRERMGHDFPKIRRLIVSTLLEVSRDGYSLNRQSARSLDLDRTVEDMVTSSSQRLWIVTE